MMDCRKREKETLENQWRGETKELDVYYWVILKYDAYYWVRMGNLALG